VITSTYLIPKEGGSIPNTLVWIRELYNPYILFNLFFLDAVWIRFCRFRFFNNVDSIIFKSSLFLNSVWIRYFDTRIPIFRAEDSRIFRSLLFLNSVWPRYILYYFIYSTAGGGSVPNVWIRYFDIRIPFFRALDIFLDIRIFSYLLFLNLFWFRYYLHDFIYSTSRGGSVPNVGITHLFNTSTSSIVGGESVPNTRIRIRSVNSLYNLLGMVSVPLYHFSYSAVGGGSIPNTRVRIRGLYNMYITLDFFFLDIIFNRLKKIARHFGNFFT